MINLSKNIFLSVYTFIGITILSIIFFMFIQYKYFQLIYDQNILNSMKYMLSNLFVLILIVTFFYVVLFIQKVKKYLKIFSSYTKPFEFVSTIISILFAVGTLLWEYKLIKFNTDIEINKITINFINAYFNLFVFFDIFLLSIIIFSLLLDFNIKDYKKKNRLYQDHILTKNGWIKGNSRLSDSLEKTILIGLESSEILLVIRAYINYNKTELYAERQYIEFSRKKNNLHKLLKEDFYIEELELIEKHYSNELISKYFYKYKNFAFLQNNIKNIEILEKFENIKVNNYCNFVTIK